jgi:hypothetical protein
MNLFEFTPTKFVTLLLAALAVALATNNIAPAPHRSAELDLAGIAASEAVGQDNGTLTSGFYLDAGYTPTPVTRTPDRHTVLEPQSPAPQPVRRNYPPMVR